MRSSLVLVLALLLIATACAEDKPAAPASPAAPHSRALGEDCVKPDDCQEGLWCLDGRCRKALNQGNKRVEEMEQMQDERYEQFDNKLRSVEEQLRQ